MLKFNEWQPEKKWNPFNSYKLLAHVYRWRLIKRGQRIPQPGLVTVDPINTCNLTCVWCNSSVVLKERNQFISKDTLINMAEFLATWQGNSQWEAGVEAVCIAGGGEPLLHPETGHFIEACVSRGIEVGVVTNGTKIDQFIEPLSLCTWVGISVDAGSSSTFIKLKNKNRFDKICNNIEMLSEYINNNPCQLSTDRPGYGISYKYLLYNSNIHEIQTAAAIAKKIGCKNFHLRPAGVSWDKLGVRNEKIFNPTVRQTLSNELTKTRELEDNYFNIYGITHKFDSELNAANYFNSCHAIFMTAVFMPPRYNKNEKFCLGLCCDRRGDNRLEAPVLINDFNQVSDFWGSKHHWQIHDSINLNECPRCTYQPHNQIFEHVIEKDSMTYKFI